MSASRAYARAAWSVSLLLVGVTVMPLRHVALKWHLVTAIATTAIWLLGWRMPRALQTLLGAVRWVCRTIGRLLRSYVSAILLAFVFLTAAGSRRHLTAVSRPPSWLQRPPGVHVRICRGGGDYELLHSALPASGYMAAAVIAALGWCLRQLPESAQSGRIRYGTYTLQ